MKLSNGQSNSIGLTKIRRMVVTMSDTWARKNAADRGMGLKRHEKRFKSDRLTKGKPINRSHNHILSMSGDAVIRINYD